MLSSCPLGNCHPSLPRANSAAACPLPQWLPWPPRYRSAENRGPASTRFTPHLPFLFFSSFIKHTLKINSRNSPSGLLKVRKARLYPAPFNWQKWEQPQTQPVLHKHVEDEEQRKLSIQEIRIYKHTLCRHLSLRLSVFLCSLTFLPICLFHQSLPFNCGFQEELPKSSKTLDLHMIHWNSSDKNLLSLSNVIRKDSPTTLKGISVGTCHLFPHNLIRSCLAVD